MPKLPKNTRVYAVDSADLPRFNTITDISRYADSLREEITDLNNLVKVQQKLVSHLLRTPVNAAGMSFDLSPDLDRKGPPLKRKIDPKLEKVIVPNIKKLSEQYKLAEELYEKKRTLDALKTQLTMQFSNQKDDTSYGKAMAGINSLSAQVDSGLKDVLEFLSDVADRNIPPTFEKYCRAIVQEIEEHVAFEQSHQFMYASVNAEGNLVFTNYIMLQNAVNDEGEVTPNLYISLQWVVGESVGVALNHEYELPQALEKNNDNVEVETVGEAVKAISNLLDMEDFATSLGTVPLATQMIKNPRDIQNVNFSYKELISKIDVDQDSITFHFRNGLSKEETQNVCYGLYQEIKTLFHNSRTVKLRMQMFGTKTVTFTLKNVGQRNEVTTHDAEFLARRFGLNNTQLRKVCQLLNQGDKSSTHASTSHTMTAFMTEMQKVMAGDTDKGVSAFLKKVTGHAYDYTTHSAQIVCTMETGGKALYTVAYAGESKGQQFFDIACAPFKNAGRLPSVETLLDLERVYLKPGANPAGEFRSTANILLKEGSLLAGFVHDLAAGKKLASHYRVTIVEGTLENA